MYKQIEIVLLILILSNTYTITLKKTHNQRYVQYIFDGQMNVEKYELLTLF